MRWDWTKCEITNDKILFAFSSYLKEQHGKETESVPSTWLFLTYIFLNPDRSLLKGNSGRIWLFITRHCFLFLWGSCRTTKPKVTNVGIPPENSLWKEFRQTQPFCTKSSRRYSFRYRCLSFDGRSACVNFDAGDQETVPFVWDTLHRRHRAFRLLFCWSSGETNAADSCYISICFSSTEIRYVHLH